MNSPEFGPSVNPDNLDIEPIAEQEPTAEREPSFPVVVVLGGGFKRTDLGVELGLPSRLRVLAAGEMLKDGIAKRIILSGGKTAGEENPSEAEVMRDYIHKRWPDIELDRIILEEESLDTTENMENTKKILDQEGLGEAVILTSKSHLKRAQHLAREYGLEETVGKSAEDELARRSHHYEHFLERYKRSCESIKARAVEFFISSVMIVNRKGTIFRRIAHRTRQ